MPERTSAPFFCHLSHPQLKPRPSQNPECLTMLCLSVGRGSQPRNGTVGPSTQQNLGACLHIRTSCSTQIHCLIIWFHKQLAPSAGGIILFPSVDFGSSHREAIQAVKSLLILLVLGCSECTDSQGSSCHH